MELRRVDCEVARTGRRCPDAVEPPGTIRRVDAPALAPAFAARTTPHDVGLVDLLGAAAPACALAAELVLLGIQVGSTALAMAYKLLDAAQERWQRFNGDELVADVLNGASFKDGIRVPDDDTHDNEMTGEEVVA